MNSLTGAGKFTEMTSSYLTILHKMPRKQREWKVSQKSGLVTYKNFVEAKGEYQTTWYPTSKPLNTR